MITVFRRLREKLVRENNIRRYLVYAVGEILLVVIGILLALQVNNWNEARIEAIQQGQVLRSLHNEFADNLTQLNYDISRLDSSVKATKTVLKLMSIKKIPNGINVDSLIGLTLQNPTWNPSSYVLNDLKNSGQISRLSNPELQRKLFAWERRYENTIEISLAFVRSTMSLIQYISENGSLRNVDSQVSNLDLSPSQLGFDNRVLLKDIRFENYVDDKFLTSSNLLTDYRNTIPIIEEILNLTEL